MYFSQHCFPDFKYTGAKAKVARHGARQEGDDKGRSSAYCFTCLQSEPFLCYQKCCSLPQSRPCKTDQRSLGCLQGGKNNLKIKLAFQMLLLPSGNILILHAGWMSLKISTSTNFLLLCLRNLWGALKAHPSLGGKIMFNNKVDFANFTADVKFGDKG